MIDHLDSFIANLELVIAVAVLLRALLQLITT